MRSTRDGLRLVALDATDTGWVAPRLAPAPASERARDGTAQVRIGLAPFWRVGASMHRVLGAADAWLAARSWTEAIAWAIATAEQRERRIGALQLWGHGGWGFMRLGDSRLDTAALARGHALAAPLDALRRVLAGPDALVWLRCCSAFAHDGRAFAVHLAERLGARVAGHTYIIGVLQSGTHAVAPGHEPSWDPAEGVRWDRGQPVEALKSSPFAPNTITCMRAHFPDPP